MCVSSDAALFAFLESTPRVTCALKFNVSFRQRRGGDDAISATWEGERGSFSWALHAEEFLGWIFEPRESMLRNNFSFGLEPVKTVHK